MCFRRLRRRQREAVFSITYPNTDVDFRESRGDEERMMWRAPDVPDSFDGDDLHNCPQLSVPGADGAIPRGSGDESRVRIGPSDAGDPTSVTPELMPLSPAGRFPNLRRKHAWDQAFTRCRGRKLTRMQPSSSPVARKGPPWLYRSAQMLTFEEATLMGRSKRLIERQESIHIRLREKTPVTYVSASYRRTWSWLPHCTTAICRPSGEKSTRLHASQTQSKMGGCQTGS